MHLRAMHRSSLAALTALALLSAPGVALSGAPPGTETDMLQALVGEWSGTVKTWFEPGVLADESDVRGTIASTSMGNAVRHTYTSAIMDRPRQGEELLSYNPPRQAFQATWIDDFHMNYGIFIAEGSAVEGGFSVQGEYDVSPGEPRWGWRTEYVLEEDDRLVITAYNITPDGQEAMAVQTVYSRVEGEAQPASDLRVLLSSIFVDDQAKALAFYTGTLGLEPAADIDLGPYRWLTVAAPAGPAEVELLLEPDAHPAAAAFQQAMYQDGIPATILFVDDIDAAHERLEAGGVEFRSPPSPPGAGPRSATLDDTCGNWIQITQV